MKKQLHVSQITVLGHFISILQETVWKFLSGHFILFSLCLRKSENKHDHFSMKIILMYILLFYKYYLHMKYYYQFW